jgi:AcrR family transcriptional regulator
MTSPKTRPIRRPVASPEPPSIEGESRAPRAPQQSRGQKRVDEILDAAEAVIAEHGLDAATTNAIAERAGSSVGSLYHFFPSKDAIVQALALRFSAMMRDLNAEAMPPSAVDLPLEKLFERIVMVQVRLIDERPAFSAVYDASCRDVLGAQAYEEMERVILGQVEDYLAARLPRMPKKDRKIAARMSVTVVNHVLEDARLAPSDMRHGIVRELQHLMVRYFEPLDAQYRRGD